MRALYQVVTFLAPNMTSVYAALLDHVGARLSCRFELVAGKTYDDVARADFAFICGLPYVLRTPPRTAPPLVKAIAAPVLIGERYQNKPIYFSDVIVNRDSSFQSFADLRGRSWAYNEPESQSGYGITRYSLLKRGETNGYFGQVVEAGYHQKAIRMVARGQIDASAIDSHVLAIELRDHSELTQQIRVIDVIGPSTIQPFAASSSIPASLKADIQGAFVDMHHEGAARTLLERGLIDHFVAIDDTAYDDIRDMLAVCERAGFLTVK